MKKTLVALWGALVLVASGCVGNKVYRAEKTARVAAETREKVLVTELLDRKKEAVDLTKMVGDLNRTIGRQEEEMKDLESELVARTQSMGASTSKLATEKSSLEKQLGTTNELLEQCHDALNRVHHVQDKRKAILKELEGGLQKTFQANQSAGVTMVANSESVVLTIPDKSLFDAGGVSISAAGKTLMTALAEFLAARPALDVEILAFTDNVLPPKEKQLKDTWDWSLQRATAVVRMLSRELNVNANQLTAIGRGEFYPLTSNETPEGRAQNRRTELIFRPVLPAIPEASE